MSEARQQQIGGLNITGEEFVEYELAPDAKPPATNHKQQVVTTCFVDEQWYAGTCGRFFAPVSRRATVFDCAEIAYFGQAYKDTDGSGAIRCGVVSFETLKRAGAKFHVQIIIKS